jgi:hypothetical protein
LIQGKRLDPQNGRLLLADLSGAEPLIVQKSIDLPRAGSLTAINNDFVLEVSDRALDELIQKDDDVRNFLRGEKLIEIKTEKEGD